MTWGPWQDGPGPITDSTIFNASDHAPRFYSDPNPLFGGIVGELTWQPNWFMQRQVENIHLDGDPRYQQVWDKVRGFDPQTLDSGLLYTGSNAAAGSFDWSVTLRREAIELDLSNLDQYVAMVHQVGSSVFYNIDPLPPGVTAVEIENGGYGHCTGTVAVSWTAPTDPGDPDYELSDIANIGGLLLAPFNLPSGGDINYPYNALTALSPPPSGSLDFVDNSYVQALPDALLNYVAPPAFLQPFTDWRADSLHFSVSFTMTFPRYRFQFSETPARRLYPRTDSVGPGLGRIYPPPNTQQSGGRFGSAAPL